MRAVEGVGARPCKRIAAERVRTRDGALDAVERRHAFGLRERVAQQRRVAGDDRQGAAKLVREQGDLGVDRSRGGVLCGPGSVIRRFLRQIAFGHGLRAA